MSKARNAVLLTFAIFGISGAGMLLLFGTMAWFEDYAHYFLMLCSVLILVLGGAVMLAALFTRVFAEEEGEGCIVPVRAVITNVRESSVHLGDTREKATVYMPDYTFELSGETKTLSSYQGSYRKKHYVVGTQVDMLVNPDKPSHCYIPADTRRKVRRLNFIWIPMMAVGAAAYIAGILLG